MNFILYYLYYLTEIPNEIEIVAAFIWLQMDRWIDTITTNAVGDLDTVPTWP